MVRQLTPGQRFGRFPGVSLLILLIPLAGIAAVAALLYYPRHWRVSTSPRQKPLRGPRQTHWRQRMRHVQGA